MSVLQSALQIQDNLQLTLALFCPFNAMLDLNTTLGASCKDHDLRNSYRGWISPSINKFNAPHTQESQFCYITCKILASRIHVLSFNQDFQANSSQDTRQLHTGSLNTRFLHLITQGISRLICSNWCFHRGIEPLLVIQASTTKKAGQERDHERHAEGSH